jgi:dipeptidyl aminopeptidase/acylaminoacyl peptidase
VPPRAAFSGWELRLEKLWSIDAETGEVDLLSGAFEGNIREPVWSPDCLSIYFAGQQGVDTSLFRLDNVTGEVERLGELSGSAGSVSWSADRSSVAFTWSDSDTPSQLRYSETEQVAPRALAQPNAWVEAELALASARTLRWSSYDGLEVEGVLYLPPSWREGQRVPLMLNIHGGPAGVFSNSFRGSYHVYAGMGFASLCPNVRGSSGYTDELLRGNMGDIGRGDYEDLMSGVDAVIERGIADPARLAVRGWSYGGILGGVTITKTDRFQAASLGAMVSDWTSEYGPGFNHDVRLWYIGGTPWENPDGYRDASALTHVANVSTPTILFHGDEDTTDTEPQSMMFFQALKDRGVPCRYLRFPREPHGLREPRHQRTRDVEELRWMRKYVLGDDAWEPWPAPVVEDSK